MLELFGSGYVIDHCVSAFSKGQQEKLYRMYLTDALKVISENTAGGEHRSAMSKRWIDLAEPKKPEETRNADEIISDFKRRLNGGERK